MHGGCSGAGSSTSHQNIGLPPGGQNLGTFRTPPGRFPREGRGSGKRKMANSPMPMDWSGLYTETDRLDLSRRRLLAAQAEFEEWARDAERRAIAEAQACATARGRELWERTHVGVV